MDDTKRKDLVSEGMAQANKKQKTAQEVSESVNPTT